MGCLPHPGTAAIPAPGPPQRFQAQGVFVNMQEAARVIGRAIAATAVCTAAIGLMPAHSPITATAAADWQLQTRISGERYRPNLPMLGISCPSRSLCVAVGELDTIVSTTDPTGGSSAWHV